MVVPKHWSGKKSGRDEWAGELLANMNDYFTKEEAVELSLKLAKESVAFKGSIVRVWKSRFVRGTLGKKTINRLLVFGKFEPTITLYRQIKTT